MLPYVAHLKGVLYGDYTTPRKHYRARIDGFVERGAKRILDVGCGYAAPELERLTGPGLLKVGIDMATGLDGQRAPSTQLMRGDCCRLPLGDPHFDLVISMSVLEHVENPGDAFCEIARVLAPGGHFVFLTPNRWDYISVGSTLIPNRYHAVLVEKLTDRPAADTFPTCYRANTIPALRRLATAARLDVVELIYLREHPHYLQKSRVLYTLGAMYEQVIERNVPRLRPWILGVLQKPIMCQSGDNGELK